MWIRIVLVLSLVLSASCVLARSDPAAVITQISGKGTVLKPQGTRLAAKARTRLYVGDRLRLAARATATVVYPDRPATTLRGGAKGATFSIAKPGRVKQGSVLARLWAYLLARLRAPSRGGPVGGSRDLVVAASVPAPALLRPANTRETASPPVFYWSEVAGASYTLIILDSEAVEVWTGPAMTACVCAYPPDAPPLKPGERYWWEVRASTADRVASSLLAWFEVVDEEERARLAHELVELDKSLGEKPDPMARHISRATFLASEGLIADATQEALAAHELKPDDEALTEMLRIILVGPTEEDAPEGE